MSESLNLKEDYAEAVETAEAIDYQLHLYFCEDSTGSITPIEAASPVEAYCKVVIEGLVKTNKVTVSDSHYTESYYFDFMDE